jgi:hypothetical protein
LKLRTIDVTKIVSERAVKRRIKEVLDKYKSYHIYVYMPVPGGYGTSTLDYLGFLRGRGFAIEAKASNGRTTPRQDGTIATIEASGCPVFIIRDDQELLLLDEWLASVVK